MKGEKNSKIILFVLAVLAAGPAFAFAEDVLDEFSNSNSSVNDEMLVDKTFELGRKKTQEIFVEGLESTLVMDPSVVIATQDSAAGRILLQTQNYGRTYVHAWTKEGRKTYLVTVVPSYAMAGKALEEKARKQAMSIRHKLATNITQTKNGNSTYKPSWKEYTYDLAMDGKTSLGRNDTALRYEEMNDKKRLASFKTKFSGAAGEMEAGDVNYDASRLAFPSMSYQGLRLQTAESKRVVLNMVGGYMGQGGLWGRYTDADKETFAGANADIKLTKHMTFFAGGAETTDSGKGELLGQKGAGLRYQRSRVGLEFEKAFSNGGAQASLADVEYRANPLYFTYSYRNVDSDYRTVNGSSYARGETGQRFQIGSSEVGILKRMNISYDQFRNGYRTNDLQPFSLNREIRGQLEFGGKKSWKLTEEIAEQDYPGLSSPYQSRLMKTRYSHAFGNIEPNVSCRVERRDFFEEGRRDFRETGLGYGVRFNPFKFMTLNVAIENVLSKNLQSGESRTLRNANIGMRMSGSFYKPLKNSLQLDYSESEGSISSKVRTYSAQMRADYSAGGGIDFFAMGRFENRMGADVPVQSVQMQTGIQFGGSIRGNTHRAQKVAGYVFKDLNGDGTKQDDEPGLPGIRVILNDKTARVSGGDGKFKFGSAKGELTVKLDLSALPKGMRLSSSNPQTIAPSEEGGTVFIYFGCAYLGDISGTVRIDSNENGVFDADDVPVRKAVVAVDEGKTGTTDEYGNFVIPSVSPGKRNASLNMLSLPQNMMSVGAYYRDFDLGEGESKEFSFLIRPVRSIGGTVYWDRNGNGRMDPDELGVEGVRVFMGDSEVHTDNNGRYYLKGFKSGRVVLDADVEALGKKGWKISGNFLPQTFDIAPADPFVRRNLDIPLDLAE